MDPGRTSYELLAHFDRPKTVDMPDFESVNEFLVDAPLAAAGHRPAPPQAFSEQPTEFPRIPERGVCWVLQWAATFAVLAVAGSVLTEFAYLLVAERDLALAARAGAMEATLPRATYQSVIATIDRRLAEYPSMSAQLQMTFTQNGVLVESPFRQHAGDRYSITLDAPSRTAVPEWLRTILFWRHDSKIQAHAERQMPGRTIARPTPAHTAAE